jgi:hypothetical protein
MKCARICQPLGREPKRAVQVVKEHGQYITALKSKVPSLQSAVAGFEEDNQPLSGMQTELETKLSQAESRSVQGDVAVVGHITKTESAQHAELSTLCDMKVLPDLTRIKQEGNRVIHSSLSFPVKAITRCSAVLVLSVLAFHHTAC